ncbi:hypothetical protein HUO13_07215 [Saccharopolyspora erythraea]|uniref:hypothetical protein n=1 Tax=Saccharopolyspora erythraea TaxID=1836 RepID=UPI001BA79396|nr:hypothetical protein [Saccharopolyspora erythraea]QUH00633.1 hypothetical protein HUO13_07215 [Saccharopolyspora erythraea]
MDGNGFHVEIEVLERASKRMEELVAGQDNSELSELPGQGSAYGHADLEAALNEFCDRWSVGLDALCDRATRMGYSLGEAAKAYREADQAGADALAVDPAIEVVQPPAEIPGMSR